MSNRNITDVQCSLGDKLTSSMRTDYGIEGCDLMRSILLNLDRRLRMQALLLIMLVILVPVTLIETKLKRQSMFFKASISLEANIRTPSYHCGLDVEYAKNTRNYTDLLPTDPKGTGPNSSAPVLTQPRG